MAGSVCTLPRARAITALDRLISEAQSESPFEPVTVVTSSAKVAIHVARALTSTRSTDPSAARAGLVNVNFVTLARLAEELGTPALRRRSLRRLTRTALTAAVRVELARRPLLFGAATMHPATAAEVVERYGELRFAGSLEDVPSNGQLFGPSSDVLLGARAYQLRSLCRELRSLMKMNFYDDVDLFESAVTSLLPDGIRGLGVVVVYLPDRVRPCELDLLARIGDVVPVTALLGLVGRSDLDEHARGLAEHLSHRLGLKVTELAVPANGSNLVPDLLVTTPNPRAEVRAAIRLAIDRLADGVSPERLALLFAVREPYLSLLVSELSATGVEFNSPAVTNLAEEAAGRLLLGLVDLVVGPIRRREVISLLRSVPVVDEQGMRVPVAEWDRVSQLAGITGGPFRDWAQRLDEYARFQQRGWERSVADTTSASATYLADLERNVAAARGLGQFVKLLGDRIAAGRSLRGWEQFGQWATGAIEALLGPSGEAAGELIESESGRARVVQAIEELSDLGLGELDLDLEAAAPLLAEELRRPGPRRGRTGRGVVVASIDQAMGVDFDFVVVVGCSSGNLPGGAPRSPLLDRSDREALELEPMTARAVAGRSERHFALLRHSVTELVTTAPVLDSNGRETAPSRFVEAARRDPAITGVLSELARVLLDQPALRSAEFESASLFAIAPAEVSIAARALGLESVAASATAVRARERREFGRFQGVVGEYFRQSVAKPYSPTAIEEVANCSYRYFFSHVLGCEVIEDPEVVMSIEPRTKGSIVHEVLERFVAAEIEAFPDALANPATLLGSIADQVMDRYERAGLTGKRVLFQAERRRIKVDLEAERVRDERQQRVGRRRPLQVEYGFGYDEVPPVEIPVSSGALSFRGKIDRVDVDEAGSLTVIDYKTGRPDPYEVIARDPVDAGRHLQLPIYALAAASLVDPPSAPVRAEFRFVGPRSLKNGSFAVAIELDDGVRERLVETVDVLTRTVATGLFPMLPGELAYGGHENCRFCDFDKVCPTARARYEESARRSRLVDEYFDLLDGPDTGAGPSPSPFDD